MPRPRSLYHKAIIVATGCTDAEVPYVESLMRDAHGGVLDHLPSDKFTRAAKAAHKAWPRVKRACPNWEP